MLTKTIRVFGPTGFQKELLHLLHTIKSKADNSIIKKYIYLFL